MENELSFKEIMHNPLFKKGSGRIDKLIKAIGLRGVIRLKALGCIKVDDYSWEITEDGKKWLELFNRQSK